MFGERACRHGRWRSNPAGGLLLGFALWIGFPLGLFTGAVIHEHTPWRLAAIHAGDWLVKLNTLGMMVSAWQ